jgi:hypothetical protein
VSWLYAPRPSDLDQVLVKAVHLLDNDLLVALLKTLKNISMSAKALDILQSASAIEVLVRCLLDHLYGDLHLVSCLSSYTSVSGWPGNLQFHR